MKKKRSDRHRGRVAFSTSEDINPMNYVSNLADAMLVLAVGIMLALVMAWNVDISSVSQDSSITQVDVESAEKLDQNTDSINTSDTPTDDSIPIEDYGLTEYGKVYVDGDGNMYVVTEENQG